MKIVIKKISNTARGAIFPFRVYLVIDKIGYHIGRCQNYMDAKKFKRDVLNSHMTIDDAIYSFHEGFVADFPTSNHLTIDIK